MFAQVHAPETLDPAQLDAYLEQGWFRMGQTIFTTNFLSFKNHLYSAIWLRVCLPAFVTDRTREKLSRLNSGFRTEIQKASINAVKENLFERYRKSVAFEASSSLHHLLFGKSDITIYNTYEVNIFDGDNLIATGFFDLGARSAAGISCFYDPAYKKYSLGKYLIYLKMEYCKKLGLQYFYPGYFVPGYSFFDYKLSIGKHAQQFLQLASGQWVSISEFYQELNPLRVIREKLLSLKEILSQSTIETWLWEYGFFDANLIPELTGRELFDFPLFLAFTGSGEECINQLIVYDVRDQCYHFIKCRGVWKTNAAYSSNTVYSSYVLEVEQELISIEHPEELASIILMAIEYDTKSSTG